MSTINRTAHGFTAGTEFYFGNIVPDTTGVVEGQVYYVLAAGLTADAFQFSETDGGAAFTLAEDITSGIISELPFYAPVTDPADVHAPPETPATPQDSSLVSDLHNGIVRMTFTVDDPDVLDTTRAYEVQITKEFSGTPVWDAAIVYTITKETGSLTVYALPLTQYWLRYRSVDVYGQFSAWTTFITETTVDGADSVHTANLAATVYTDEDGLHVEDGAIFIKDEFGSSTLGASGASGSWEDHALTGIKNGSFNSNATANPATVGRTAHVPYWTLAQGSGTPVFSSAPGALTIDFATVGHRGEFTSDLIRVRQGVPLTVYINDSVTDLAFTEVTREFRVLRYTAAGALIGSTTMHSEVLTGSAGQTTLMGHITPDDYTGIGATPAAFIKVYVRVTATTLSLGNATYRCNEVMLVAGDTVPRATAFPSSPELSSRVYYSGMEFYHDGARWLCTCPHTAAFVMSTTTTMPITATTSGAWHAALPLVKGLDIQLEGVDCTFLVVTGGTALGASHRWNGNIRTIPNDTIVASLAIDSGSSNVWRNVSDSGTDVLDITGSQVGLSLGWAKTGTPGNLNQTVIAHYRYIGV